MCGLQMSRGVELGCICLWTTTVVLGSLPWCAHRAFYTRAARAVVRDNSPESQCASGTRQERCSASCTMINRLAGWDTGPGKQRQVGACHPLREAAGGLRRLMLTLAVRSEKNRMPRGKNIWQVNPQSSEPSGSSLVGRPHATRHSPQAQQTG